MSRTAETIQGSIYRIVRGQRYKHGELQTLRGEKIFLGRIRMDEEKNKINESF